jgi:general secretion pathway protein K
MPRSIHVRSMVNLTSSNRGIALVMVLWVLMLLSVIVGEFCYSMKTQVNITGNYKENTEAYYIALAGLNNAIYNMVYQTVIPPPSADDPEADEDAVKWRINTIIPSIDYAGGRVEVWIDNESGRININLADRGLLMLMLSGFDLTDEEKEIIVDSIMDWRDADDLRRLHGAENEYYQSLPRPYSAKNGPFDTAEELLLVRGVTPEIYYGGLDRMVTVFPKAAPKQTSDRRKRDTGIDFNRLNINAIPPAMWAAMPGITGDMVEQLTEFRKEKDFKSMSELAEIVGNDVFSGISRHLNTRPSPYYTIYAAGKKGESGIHETIAATIRMDNTLARRYRIVEWETGVEFPASMEAGTGASEREVF